MPKKSRRTYGKSLRAICKRLRLPFVKTRAALAKATPPVRGNEEG